MFVSFTYNGQSYVNFDSESDDFKVLDIPQSEKDKIVTNAKWQLIREKRQPLIDQTDWTQMPDAQLTTEKKSEFANYRQSLRDLPQTYDNPDNVVWPEKPTV
ncbi:tail fiber assembly protein [Vibrio sp. 1865]|uniref:tail fiber assembly protein n=1 Tax=unclassified Vibrio TaxID=2614977 RepID=UPI0029640C29|nr:MULTISPECIES: tail fiber assembly protein [unclassified Vibrio]MDW2094114.1 tail fiber assembly protein [Vibrio sp. 1866]MDW3103791.1 tail fiber assembly protein [Vibrio sp. 1874]MDW3201893.1 tail fiber assembly protein [Vibrio sp. 1865]